MDIKRNNNIMNKVNWFLIIFLLLIGSLQGCAKVADFWWR